MSRLGVMLAEDCRPESCEIGIMGQIHGLWSKWCEGLTTTHKDQPIGVAAGASLGRIALRTLSVRSQDSRLPPGAANPWDNQQQEEQK